MLELSNTVFALMAVLPEEPLQLRPEDVVEAVLLVLVHDDVMTGLADTLRWKYLHALKEEYCGSQGEQLLS